MFLLGAVLYWYAERIAMGMVGARELLPGEAPALHAAGRVRCRAARGVVRPKLYVILDGYPRALSAGRGAQGGAALAVSSGLLGVATPAELEGIVAHEIGASAAPRRAAADDRDDRSRRRSIDVVPDRRVLPARRSCSCSARWPRRSCTWCSRRSGSTRPTASPRSSAARRTGSPTGCCGSSSRWGSSQFQASPATEPLYTVNPFADEGLAALFDTHPPLGERVQRLRELDPEWREKLRAA